MPVISSLTSLTFWSLFHVISIAKFKENICTEDYVKHCTSRRKRSLMAQFRIGKLPLHIETGRLRDKRINQSVCLLCNSGEVENEQHFRCLHHIF